MVYCKWDWIHRLIIDTKGAENGCCRKIFTKTKLWSAYLYSLRKRPFGSGGNATLMERLMEVFKLKCDIYTTVFLKYLAKLARAWRMPYGTVVEKEAILDRVFDVEAFRRHGSHPKLANWFSWNKSAHEQIPEFFAIKLGFEFSFIDQRDPDDCGSFEIGATVDPRKELQAILRNGGALKLGYRLMKEALHEHILILYCAEKPCWDYYTREITDRKSPVDGLRRTWQLCDGGWAREPHIFEILRHTLLELEQLGFMDIPNG